MRIARFVTTDGRTVTGKLADERSAHPLVGDLFNHPSFESHTLSVAKLLAPVLPPNIFAIGRNYRAHAAETGSAVPEKPMIFAKVTTCLNNPGDPIVIPASAPTEIDFEAELAIVIGRMARRVGENTALDYVLGYTCANDVSARDCQRNDKQWTRAKGFDTFGPLGPWIVTADELNPNDLSIRSRLNGEVMQQSSTGQMIHDCATLVSYLSHQFTLLPGTVILTGTPEGVGMARTPPVFLKAGDRIEIEIDGIGTLANPVTSERP
jgi:2-keto-4-pentenoate hydratase/2-oxohepta-3-ene-1,7-dioic acid hydratase in catechol pathway